MLSRKINSHRYLLQSRTGSGASRDSPWCPSWMFILPVIIVLRPELVNRTTRRELLGRALSEKMGRDGRISTQHALPEHRKITEKASGLFEGALLRGWQRCTFPGSMILDFESWTLYLGQNMPRLSFAFQGDQYWRSQRHSIGGRMGIQAVTGCRGQG